MRTRFRPSSILTLLIGSTFLWACGGGDADDADTGGPAAGDEAPAESPVDASTAGDISGMVSFTGTVPEMTAVDMSDEPVCADKHASQPMTQEVVVSDGMLANVFVYVREGLEGMTFPTPSEGARIDQDGCVYHPHVSGVMVGQDLIFENSDGIMHNINATPTENRPFNFSQPVEMETTRTLNTVEVMVPIRCDVHGWMNSYVGVVDHPYYAVSATDGSFDLSTLPPGDYVLEAWHERYGTQTANVTVVTGETAEVSFTFDGSQMGEVPLGDPIDPHDHHGTPTADVPETER